MKKMNKTQNKILEMIERIADRRGADGRPVGVALDLHEKGQRSLYKAAKSLVAAGILEEGRTQTGQSMVQVARAFGRVGGSKAQRYCITWFWKKETT